MIVHVLSAHPGVLPFELDAQHTPSIRVAVARVTRLGGGVPPALQHVRPCDLVIGIAGKNVESAGLVDVTSLMSTASQPVSVTFVRPVVVKFTKPGPLGLSLVDAESQVFLNVKPSGQTKVKSLKEGM